jgi:acetyl-CoA C-acetyltransferase
VERACQKAHISPLQIDLFELYDSYSIYAALSIEAAGFAEKGEGWKLAQNQGEPASISLQGCLPISTMGGLKARGNPGGATGIYQVVEATPVSPRGRLEATRFPDLAVFYVQSLGGRLHCRHPRAEANFASRTRVVRRKPLFSRSVLT